MGGWGSGRGWRGASAPTVESLRKRKIDLANLERMGLAHEGDQVSVASALVELRPHGLKVISWASNGDRTDELIPFVYTPMKFGGRRRWLSCPTCGRRRRVLYCVQRFRCRKCLGLVYESTREPLHRRVLDQADKLSYRVAGAASDLYDRDEFPEKPKRMRWTTYRRLEERYYEYMETWAVASMRRFGIKL